MNIALRNVPEDLHAELKAAAKRNHRSLNGEILARLALFRHGAARDVQELLERNRRRREQIEELGFSTEEARALRAERDRALLKRIEERRKTLGHIDVSVETVNAFKSEGRL